MVNRVPALGAAILGQVSPEYPFLDHPGPIPFAHRGGSRDGLENSLPAFDHAVALGYRYLETDVRATADGVLLAFHDQSLDRVTDRTGDLARLTHAEVAQARIGGREPIPLLEDVLGAFPRARLNIDVKAENAVAPLTEALRRTNAWDRVCVTSFSSRRLRHVRARMRVLAGREVCTALGPARRRRAAPALPRRPARRSPARLGRRRALRAGPPPAGPRAVRHALAARRRALPRPAGARLDRQRRRRDGPSPRPRRGRDHHRRDRDAAGPHARPRAVGDGDHVSDPAATAAAAPEAVAVAGQRRREQRGWYFYDWADSAFSTTVLTVFLGPYLSDVAKAAADARGYVHPLGLDVRAKAVYPFAVAISVIVQVLLLPAVGALIDHTGRKRAVLGVCAYAGAFATVGLYFAADGRYLLGAGLLVAGNLALGCSEVAYNSFLPDIARPDERDAVSSRGWGIGYLGGGLLLALNLVLYLMHDTFGLSEGMAVRISLASAGLWWAGFTLIPLRRLRDRHRARPGESAYRVARAGFAQLGSTLRDLRNRPVTLMFLLAFLIYNDGVQTVINLSATYATQELDLGQSVVIGAVLLVQFVAFGGALLLGRLAAAYGTRRVVLGSLVAWTVVVLASFTLQVGSAVQFIVLAGVIGVVLGGTQALSRSLFSHLVPAERTAEYFGFYEISDKGTSWLGPLVFAIVLQLTDSYRGAIVSLVVFFVAGFVLLLRVDVPRGIREAGNTPPRRL